ncbi:hypothetical protein KBI23_00460 [bacterium]|nr:hypothetical protein [bacterium]MBP9809091.1 hypothetical protein [bacterium]
MTFKAAYVRQTLDHQVIAPSVFGFAALALTPFFIKEEKPIKALALISLASMLFIAIPANMPMPGIPPLLIYPTMLFGNLYDAALRLPQCALVVTGQSKGPADYQKRMLTIKEKNRLPDLDGTVDLLPAQLNVVIAHRYDYQPRPVIQSYLAYKESLIETNTNFWAKAKAADFVVLQEMQDTYGYYPTVHDGPSWLELLSRYEPTRCQPSGLIVKKRAQPRGFKLKALETIHAKLGEPVKIATNDKVKIVFAKINVKITPLGSLQKLFFRIYPPAIAVQMKSGKKETYVAPTDNLRAGFILSPFVSAPEEIEALYSDFISAPGDRQNSNDVVEFTIGERKNDFPWHILSDHCTIELFSLENHN